MFENDFHEDYDDQTVSEDHEEGREELWSIKKGDMLINIPERRNQIESCGLMLHHSLVVHASNSLKSFFEWVLWCF